MLNWTDEQSEIFARCVELWGEESQWLLALEELSELQKELILGMRRKKGKNLPEIIEEMADVYVTLEQIRRICNIPAADIQKHADAKMTRLKERQDKWVLNNQNKNT